MIGSRLTIMAILLVCFIAYSVTLFFYGASYQKTRMLASMKDNRITVLVDGKKIDEKVENSTDDELCAILGGC